MKKCKSCGAENRKESNYCHNCGAILNTSTFNKTNKNSKAKSKKPHKLNIIRILIIIFFIYVLVYGIVYTELNRAHYTEDEPTNQQELFDEFDSNNDGAISLSEIAFIIDNIPYDHLSQMFDVNDKNDNGVLKGAEFDDMIASIKGYYRSAEMKKKIMEGNEKKEETTTSSSSSSSSSSHKSQYVDGCPECGYNEMYSYQDSDGRTIYQCSVCDYWSYYEWDFLIEPQYAKSSD